ncbi:uncharacterized protein LOC129877055 isoform X2 [Solanum dulcamara]|uniref:uncharacterized protein LOC129877055 isoform X2 n=1 Tax=Solanum dulcamara TaxID=45834 RepID=UPI0024854783|nr:uncharacterized protein LOC129877055 isoform X2 [Solanum dulcamara]
MATTFLRTPTTTLSPPSNTVSATAYSSVKPNCITFLSYSRCGRRPTPLLPRRCRSHHFTSPVVQLKHRSVEKFVIFASNEDVAEAAETETQEPEQVLESEQEENLDGAAAEEASDEGDNAAAEQTLSVIATSLELYRDALANNDDSKVAEIEISLKSIEDEKNELQTKVASLTDELSSERDRVLRISADFDNFRKRTERERASLVTNAQGEVVEKLLSVMDNFERAKMQIKVATEGEEKINNSYQSISKQFMEILGSLGVEPVETVGKPFDPLASSRVGSKFSRIIDELFQKLSNFYSVFRKTST